MLETVVSVPWLVLAKAPSRVAQANSSAASLAAAHARFARAALAIYVATAAFAMALLVGLLVTERQHEEDRIREQLLLEADEHEHNLARHLGTLVQELRRLGLRSEVDLFDQNLAPEKSLLSLSHQGSSFFNLGVAILDIDGKVAWSEPQNFLSSGASFADEPWFAGVRRTRTVHLVPVDPDRAEDAVLYVVSPIVRDGAFVGALLGAVDLARGDDLGTSPGAHQNVQTVLATAKGAIVYPPTPPAFASSAAWKKLFDGSMPGPQSRAIELDGRRTEIAASSVAGTDLVYLLVTDEDALFHDTNVRLRTRLALAMVLAAIPMVLLIALLRRSLRIFRDSEVRALREERLYRVGEAANLIAHEVKNSLNGISMAVESVADDSPAKKTRRETARRELRNEIARLSTFTTELMTFSKGVVARKATLDLNEFVPDAASLTKESAEDLGATVEITVHPEPISLKADPSLLHIVLINLITNAIEASAAKTGGEGARVEVKIRRDERSAIIEVSDNGPGVSPEMRDRLFEPFQSGKPNGVGIGLALSRRIALAHGGNLSLRDGSPGATFVVTLPLEELPLEES